MTTIQKHNVNELEELLIKNLPAQIGAGNKKYNANMFKLPTKAAINKYKFINFNSKQRISFMIFDIDEFNDINAKEYFKDIDGLFDFIADQIGLEPTYILETDRGFHFAYHLKNHIFTNQSKVLKYYMAIKETIINKLQCDVRASNKNYGVFRNPLRHKHYYSHQINYELNDFKFLLPKRSFNNRIISNKVNTSDDQIIRGQRSNVIFKFGMRYAKAQSITSVEDIFEFINNLNIESEEPLPTKDIRSTAKQIYKYWIQNKIKFGVAPKKNIKEGVMRFDKMRNLSKSEYDQEVKKRQKQSALYAVEKRDKEKNKEQIKKVRQEYLEKKYIDQQEKVKKAVEYFKENSLKINVSRIAKYCNLDRRCVKKYESEFI